MPVAGRWGQLAPEARGTLVVDNETVVAAPIPQAAKEVKAA